MLKLISRSIAFICFLLSGVSLAQQSSSSGGSTTSLGGVADNLMEPVTILANFIGAIAIIVGISFLFAAFIKYMQHRVNPLAVPISTVVLLLVMGVCLLLIPLAYKLTESGFALSFY